MNSSLATTWKPVPLTDEVGLPPIRTVQDSIDAGLPVPPELVEGMIHQGGKVSLAGGSKSYKTWVLTNLALCIASGCSWFGRSTSKGDVLYLNFEIPEVFFIQRVQRICEAMDTPLPGGFHAIHLRGHANYAKEFFPRVLRVIGGHRYAMVVVDPFYKLLGGRDENSAGDVSELLNDFEKLSCATGAAVVYGCHYSKGNQAGKQALDRASGSGVFARDPDTILTLTQHSEKNAFVLESVLRNFPAVDPTGLRWDFPLMRIATDLDPKKLQGASDRTEKIIPEKEQYLSLFSVDRYMTVSEIDAEFVRRGWDKSKETAIRQQCVEEKTLHLVIGPRGSKKLRRIPVPSPTHVQSVRAAL